VGVPTCTTFTQQIKDNEITISTVFSYWYVLSLSVFLKKDTIIVLDSLEMQNIKNIT
jgi:hypothetical protein